MMTLTEDLLHIAEQRLKAREAVIQEIRQRFNTSILNLQQVSRRSGVSYWRVRKGLALNDWQDIADNDLVAIHDALTL